MSDLRSDYMTLWNSGVLVEKKGVSWRDCLLDGVPLLGFSRPEVEWLPPDEVAPLEFPQWPQGFSVFATAGTGELWAFWAEGVSFVEHEPTRFRGYAPTFGHFVFRLMLENMMRYDITDGKYDAPTLHQIFVAGARRAAPILGDKLNNALTGLLGIEPSVTTMRMGDRDYRFATYLSKEEAERAWRSEPWAYYDKYVADVTGAS